MAKIHSKKEKCMLQLQANLGKVTQTLTTMFFIMVLTTLICSFWWFRLLVLSPKQILGALEWCQKFIFFLKSCKSSKGGRTFFKTPFCCHLH
jgi:drug/metabolite transporter (DMT)-like permease